MFDIRCEYYPVPRPEHFNPEMQRLYGEALSSITEKKIQDAVSETWKRLIEPVQAMAEKLSQPDAIFRDSLVSNVREMVELVPMLNLTNDRRLTEAARLIQTQLANFDADSVGTVASNLRDSRVDRREFAERAASLVARFGNLGQRKLAA